VSAARVCRALIVAGLVLASAGVAFAHRRPLPLSDWGAYGPTEARCQQTLGNATARCALDVWAIRRACIESQLAGGQCDVGAADAAADQVRQRALDDVEAHCSPADLVTLQFVGSADAFADVVLGCRTLETALVSGAYGPALLESGVASVDDPTRACMRITAQIGANVLRYVARNQRHMLDRFASQPVSDDDKRLQLSQMRLRTRTANTKFAGLTARICSADDFQRIYQHPVSTFVTTIAGTVACLTGNVYPQDTIVCGSATCGNGVVEPHEDCDDGNTNDGDRCPADCLNQ